MSARRLTKDERAVLLAIERAYAPTDLLSVLQTALWGSVGCAIQSALSLEERQLGAAQSFQSAEYVTDNVFPTTSATRTPADSAIDRELGRMTGRHIE